MNYLIETKQLTKRYGSYKAVNEVNLHLEKGAIYGFIGRNGAGKTTFLKMICGMAAPTSGEITLLGKKGKELSEVMNRVGTLIEAPGIYPNMSAYDNIRLKCKAAGINKPNYIEPIIELIGLTKAGKKNAGCFSLGMKQRLGIGMALVGDPEILLLDEPINGLDPQGIMEVRETLLKLNKERGITIIISSHIIEELAKIATHFGIIDNGVLVEEMDREQLFAKCQERISIKLENPDEAVTVIKEMGYTNYKIIDTDTIEIYEKLDSTPELIFALADKKIRVQSIGTKSEALEDYFINLTGGKKNA